MDHGAPPRFDLGTAIVDWDGEDMSGVIVKLNKDNRIQLPSGTPCFTYAREMPEGEEGEQEVVALATRGTESGEWNYAFVDDDTGKLQWISEPDIVTASER